jgi:hypothetical protein
MTTCESRPWLYLLYGFKQDARIFDPPIEQFEATHSGTE